MRLFWKRRAEKRTFFAHDVCGLQIKPRENVSTPFFEKVRENLLRLFSKRRPKKTKGGEFSTIPLLFAQPSVANATSLGEYYHPFKRLKASP